MAVWITGKIINVIHWTDQLFSLIVHAPIDSFVAGQFTRIRVKIYGRMIQRAYSYLNAPNDSDLEFYIVSVSRGKCTTILNTLSPGDFITLTKESYGQFVLSEIPNCINLWMLATGTGIGPYLSILGSYDKILARFSNVVLVYATRYVKNLNYLSKMMELEEYYHGKLRVQIVLSQETSSYSLRGRIPDLIRTNCLQNRVGLDFNANDSHVMLCGNPNMIYHTKQILYEKYGMRDHSKYSPGHITQERYW